MRPIAGIFSPPPLHWVGDGFPVRSLFHYGNHGKLLDPFLLLDHAAPTRFEPTTRRRGVGMHPHRGFETVTIVYQGDAEHRDTAGNTGTIGAGDVQWMTAGRGILHEEHHAATFAREGGTFEVAQLWVNLPAAHKMTAPAYQAIVAADIPRASVADGQGELRVVAGQLDGLRGPARTHTPMLVADVRLAEGAGYAFAVADGWSLGIVAMRGDARVQGAPLREGQLAVFQRSAGEVVLQATSDTTLLILSGEPIGEPVVGQGPFVMNTSREIQQAFEDYHAGRLG